MWIKCSGRVSDSVFHLTTPVSTHMLAFGEYAAIVDTSIAALADTFVATLKENLGDEIPLKYIFLSHLHFDHVGGSAIFKRNCA